MKMFPAMVAALVVVLGQIGSADGFDEPRQAEHKAHWTQDPSSQLIFLAVMEGLYTDGVSTETVELVIGPKDKRDYDRFREHFVYACPLCHPAYEAFKLYHKRQDFYGVKVGVINTFGKGLAPKLIAQLKSDKRTLRLNAIEGLIKKWVKRRIDMMRLTDEERITITRLMKQGRNAGMVRLQQQLKNPNAQHDPNWKACAICDGSFDACRINRKERR